MERLFVRGRLTCVTSVRRPAVLTALLVLCVPLVAACSGSTAQGTVTGTVRVYGGPATPGGGQAMTGQPAAGATVSLSSNGHEAASTTADAQGRFTLTVAAGNYGVQGCGASSSLGETVTVTENQTTLHDINCSVP